MELVDTDTTRMVPVLTATIIDCGNEIEPDSIENLAYFKNLLKDIQTS